MSQSSCLVQHGSEWWNYHDSASEGRQSVLRFSSGRWKKIFIFLKILSPGFHFGPRLMFHFSNCFFAFQIHEGFLIHKSLCSWFHFRKISKFPPKRECLDGFSYADLGILEINLERNLYASFILYLHFCCSESRSMAFNCLARQITPCDFGDICPQRGTKLIISFMLCYIVELGERATTFLIVDLPQKFNALGFHISLLVMLIITLHNPFPYEVLQFVHQVKWRLFSNCILLYDSTSLWVSHSSAGGPQAV